MAMVGFVELACLKCVSAAISIPASTASALHVDVSHVARRRPRPGMEIRAEVELVAVDGRRLEFTVKVFDDPAGR